MKIPMLAVRPRLQLAYLWAALAPVAGTLAVSPFRLHIDLSNVALIYVLLVVVTATRAGRGPAVVTALLGSLLFAYVFVPPHFSLAITETQYLLSAFIMLVVALMVGHITSKLKGHADFVERKSSRSRTLYEFSNALSAALDTISVVGTATRFLSESLPVRDVRVIFPADFNAAGTSATPARIRACIDRRAPCSVPTGAGRCHLLLPLNATSGPQGVLGFEIDDAVLGQPDAVEFIETLASVISVALERARLAEQAREAEVKHAGESLRSSILGALSHDLRTPLAALVSMADTAALNKASPEHQDYLLTSIRDLAMSISRQMSNLLEMARLNAGKVELNLEWQPVDEVVGSAIQLVRAQWPTREVRVRIEPGLPPVRIDAVLMERVLWNLLENAIKYSPAETPITMDIQRCGSDIELCVSDAGPGLREADMATLFNVFQRGKRESDIAGVGLGLSISRTIVEAHAGQISAANRPGGGAVFRVTLPIGVPPELPAPGDAP